MEVRGSHADPVFAYNISNVLHIGNDVDFIGLQEPILEVDPTRVPATMGGAYIIATEGCMVQHRLGYTALVGTMLIPVVLQCRQTQCALPHIRRLVVPHVNKRAVRIAKALAVSLFCEGGYLTAS